MNHCILEVEVKEEPIVRYTQDNKTPIAEMEVLFESFRADDPPGSLKVVGWGNIAEEIKNQIHLGQRLVLEGRLRMNSVPRNDGTKEKRAELTISKFHFCNESPRKGPPNNDSTNLESSSSLPNKSNDDNESIKPKLEAEDSLSWNSSPLVPDTDDIPF